jgi:ornithine carbamoyltransferase
MGKRDAAPLRHFLDLDRIERSALRRMLEVGAAFKQGRPPNGEAKPLAGKALAIIFEKPSTTSRTT